MKQWYALYTKPNSEYQVKETLRQRSVETYLPEVNAPKSHRTRKKVPFFPCYLFIHIDLNKISASKWQWTPGLRWIVAFGDNPTAIPDQVIDLIQKKLNEINAKGGLRRSRFKKDDVVRITDGPFSDMLAVFKGSTSSVERVQVLLNFMGRMSRMQIEVDALEKTQPGTEAPKPKLPRRTRGGGRRIKQH